MPNTKFKRYCLLQIGLYLNFRRHNYGTFHKFHRLQETQLWNFLPQINICINIDIINIMFSLMLDYCYATYRSKCNIGSTPRIGIFPIRKYCRTGYHRSSLLIFVQEMLDRKHIITVT